MRVLQLGSEDWNQRYKIPAEIEWNFNNFPEPDKVVIKHGTTKKIPARGYEIVIITGKTNLTKENWKKLQWMVNPYNVLYLPAVRNLLDEPAQKFLTCQAAQEINEDPQTLIDHLQSRYFSGQSGIRIFPTNISLNENSIKKFSYLDSGHMKLFINSSNKWSSIGSYRNSLYIDTNRLIKLWLEFQSVGVQIRLKVFVQANGGDGDPKDNIILNIDYNSADEIQLPLKPDSNARYACIIIEAKGKGNLILGILHSRWSREKYGEFFTGGKRLVNVGKHEDIAYYFNPGDLKPPLNVYFSGARSLEGFEAFPLFRSLHAPALLFTDMRLSMGQFYDDQADVMGEKIKATILETLRKLHFDRSQLIMSGISMGTYPALKYGAQLSPYMINVAKPLGNLGYLAARSRLQRPDEFDTIFDIDHQLIGKQINTQNLKHLDEKFWQKFDQADLSKTRLFIGYMKNDDYDNQAIEKLKKSPAVAKAAQFSYKGYLGRHNDDPAVNYWFIGRIKQVLKDDFGRKLE
ncbi:accessory Sec system protein Asp2 [Lactobacillus crispatus]|uniref:Accessory Sec system protein Asp2 n=1 Tax=Lactobacillus crispatus TaxID=47770 RepID=A0A7H9E7N2_9LACO|nr:accessory Sec system protein Asp2 [Lactobacillus crispatus]QLL73245.1 accessory Sec system protein Asp2 [Lactobacillus crispatus]